jgi:hypothetical protein
VGYVLSGDEKPGTGHFGVEVRAESFYLHADDGMYVYGSGEGGSVEFDLDDIPKLRAVLDAVERHIGSGEES